MSSPPGPAAPMPAAPMPAAPRPAAPGEPGERPSVGEIFSDIAADLSTLMRQEVELAKAEVRESATRAGKGAGLLGGAGLAGHMTLLFISVAAWWGIGDSTGHGWSALIVGGVWLLIAVGLALAGRREITGISGVPQTAQTVKKIPAAVTGNEDRA